ncbi:MAG: hypothetical protein ABW321_32105 [Polyangiales bacterium]
MAHPGMGSRFLRLGCAALLSACSATNDAGGRAGGDARGVIPQASAEPGVSYIPNAGGSCAAISQQAQNRLAPADIIIAVDNSGSMSEEIAFVRDELNAFSQAVVASGVDVRIILISASDTPPGAAPPADGDEDSDEGDEDSNGICIAPPLGSGSCPRDSAFPSYLHVPTEVSSHDALALIVDTFPRWRDQLRPNATKTFVVVTDDDSDLSAAAFTQGVARLPGGLFPQWSFSGIYCFSECPESAAVGRVYTQLVQQSGGIAGDLCQQDFAPVFAALAEQVVAMVGLDCAWQIPPPPRGEVFNRDQVNVQYTSGAGVPTSLLRVSDEIACAAHSGWYYDDPAAPREIRACPASCAALQSDFSAEIDVLFGCDTQLAPQ